MIPENIYAPGLLREFGLVPVMKRKFVCHYIILNGGDCARKLFIGGRNARYPQSLEGESLEQRPANICASGLCCWIAL
jgi:hypothetical protein